MTRHKGGRNVTCQAEDVVTPQFACSCGKFLTYRGIPNHRNKCSEKIRKIRFPERDETFSTAGPSPLRTFSSQPTQIMPPQLPPLSQVAQTQSSPPIQYQPPPSVSPITTQLPLSTQGTIRSRLRSHKSPGSREPAPSDSSATQPNSSATQPNSSATQPNSSATQPDSSTTQPDRATQGDINISQAYTAASSQVIPANQCRFGCGKVILILARALAL